MIPPSQLAVLYPSSILHLLLYLNHSDVTRPTINWVRLGELDYSTNKDGAQPIDVKVRKTIIHPNYVWGSLAHDIALLELETSVKLGSSIRPLCLPEATTTTSPDEEATVTGWGNTRICQFAHLLLTYI